MKFKELAGKTKAELHKALSDETKNRFDLYLKKALDDLKNTAQVKLVRRNIARIKTMIAQQDRVNAKLPSKSGES